MSNLILRNGTSAGPSNAPSVPQNENIRLHGESSIPAVPSGHVHVLDVSRRKRYRIVVPIQEGNEDYSRVTGRTLTLSLSPLLRLDPSCIKLHIKGEVLAADAFVPVNATLEVSTEADKKDVAPLASPVSSPPKDQKGETKGTKVTTSAAIPMEERSADTLVTSLSENATASGSQLAYSDPTIAVQPSAVAMVSSERPRQPEGELATLQLSPTHNTYATISRSPHCEADFGQKSERASALEPRRDLGLSPVLMIPAPGPNETKFTRTETCQYKDLEPVDGVVLVSPVEVHPVPSECGDATTDGNRGRPVLPTFTSSMLVPPSPVSFAQSPNACVPSRAERPVTHDHIRPLSLDPASDGSPDLSIPATCASSLSSASTKTALPNNLLSRSQQECDRLQRQLQKLEVTHAKELDNVHAQGAEQMRQLKQQTQKRALFLHERKCRLQTELKSIRKETEIQSNAWLQSEGEAFQLAYETQDAMSALKAARERLDRSWRKALSQKGQLLHDGPQTLRQEEEECNHLAREVVEACLETHTAAAQLRILREKEHQCRAQLSALYQQERLLQHVVEDRKGAIRVVVRLRPTLCSSPGATDIFNGSKKASSDFGVEVNEREGTVTVVQPGMKRCTWEFFSVYGPSAPPDRPTAMAATAPPGWKAVSWDQHRLFEEQMVPLLESVCSTGHNVSVVAYGTTGSGKTYTILGPHSGAEETLPVATHVSNGGAREGITPVPYPFSSSSTFKYELPLNRVTSTTLQPVREVSVEANEGIGVVPVELVLRGRRVLAEANALSGVAPKSSVSSDTPTTNGNVGERQLGVRKVDGLLPQTLAWLCARMEPNRHSVVAESGDSSIASLRMSVYEVYNNHIYDLLETPLLCDRQWSDATHSVRKDNNPGRLVELFLRPTQSTVMNALPVRSSSAGWTVSAKQVVIEQLDDALRTLSVATERRRTCATARNCTSSRSHLFVQLSIRFRRHDSGGMATTNVSSGPRDSAWLHVVGMGAEASGATLPRQTVQRGMEAAVAMSTAEILFCDLAGSERVAVDKTAGARLEETQWINKSLCAVGDVLYALSTADTVSTHPYCNALGEGEDTQQMESGIVPSPVVAAHETPAAAARSGGPSASCRDSQLMKTREVGNSGSLFSTPRRRREDSSAPGVEKEKLSSRVYIPYRNSKVTQLLQGSLGGTSKTLFVACIQPCCALDLVPPSQRHLEGLRSGKSRRPVTLAEAWDAATSSFIVHAPHIMSEVLSTLRFASRAKLVYNMQRTMSTALKPLPSCVSAKEPYYREVSCNEVEEVRALGP